MFHLAICQNNILRHNITNEIWVLGTKCVKAGVGFTLNSECDPLLGIGTCDQFLEVHGGKVSCLPAQGTLPGAATSDAQILPLRRSQMLDV